jgi:hypothetical protein
MSSLVVYRVTLSDGVEISAQWNKGAPYSVRASDGHGCELAIKPYPYASRGAAIAAVQRKARQWAKQRGASILYRDAMPAT